MAKKHPHDGVRLKLRALGLKYPEAVLKRPWPEHLDLVVKSKTFAFMNSDGLPLKISCKLPRSRGDALAFPFASPTRYGLGRSGWVSAVFEPDAEPPLELLKQWIDESYRAQAPKSLTKQLAQPADESKKAQSKKTKSKKSESKKSESKRPKLRSAPRRR